jgi:hypothetical protein
MQKSMKKLKKLTLAKESLMRLDSDLQQVLGGHIRPLH